MDEKECPLCIDKRGRRWTESVALGNKTVKEAATAFAMAQADVEEHLYKHATEVTFIKDHDKQYDREYYVKRLDNLGRDINRWLEVMLDEEVNGDNIRSLTTLTREFRETLRLLAEVTKVIKDDDAATLERQVTMMRDNYLAITNIVTNQVCPECRSKVLAALETRKVLLHGAAEKAGSADRPDRNGQGSTSIHDHSGKKPV